MILLLILITSILLQFAAAYLALRLIWVTGKKRAWALIAIAIFLMALRRCITLSRLISGNITLPPDLTAELVALAISILMLAGIALIAPLFLSVKRADKALLESEKKYRSLFETSRDAVYLSSLEGYFIDINRAGVDLLGYTRDELLSTKIEKIYVNYADREKFIREVKDRGFVKDYEVKLKKKDNAPIDVLITAVTRKDKNNLLMGFQGIIRDITEKKHAEEILTNIAKGVSATTGKEFFRSLVKYISKALNANYAFIGELCRENNEKVKTIAVCKDGKLEGNFMYKLENTPCSNVMKKMICIYPQEVQKLFPLDTMLMKMKAESYTGTSLNDSTGQILGIMAVLSRKPFEKPKMVESMLKIFAARASAELERMQVEEALSREKEQLAVTLRSIGDGVITTDTEGRVILMNRMAEKFVNWKQEDAAGKMLTEVFRIINEQTREPCTNPVEKVMEAGHVVGLANHTVLIARDGTERIIADSGAPICDKDSKIIGVVLVFSDITEKRKIERELLKAQKLESLGLLAGGIAHDFNNVLTAILGNISIAKMALNQDINIKIEDILENAEKASIRAKGLTQQLLTFSKGGAPVKKTVDISGLVKETMKFSLQGTASKCLFDISSGKYLLDIDENQISQVINNLAINADQSMPEGGIIKVRMDNIIAGVNDPLPVKQGLGVKISIKDHGAGISPEHVEKIFDPYFTTKGKGSGLGLSASYSIIKNHGGHISVDSKLGKGSTFHVYLPITDDAPQSIKKKKEKTIRGVGRVLVMDDEKSLRESLQIMLATLGYSAELAKNGEEAVEKYKEAKQSGQAFDAVILDLTIPGGMGGKKAVQELKKIDPNVKAVVSSGYSNDPVMANYREYGFVDILEKPYEVRKLSSVLHGIIKKDNDT